MTIDLYVVHIFKNGRYVRTVEEAMPRRSAHRFAKTYTALNGEFDKEVAVVEVVPVVVAPPDRLPKTDPLGPGMRPTRRTPAVV